MILTENKNYSLHVLIVNGTDSGLDREDCEMEFSGLELLRALFATELPVQCLTPGYEGKRQMEVLYKVALVETALAEEGDRLKRARALDALEGSERSLIFHYIGLIFIRLIAGKLFGCDFLTHMSLIPGWEESGGPDGMRKDRQGSVGYCRRTGRFSVWEAIGKSENSPRTLLEGCTRAGAVRSICGEPSGGAYACMTYFENGYLTAVVQRPSAEECAKARRELDFDRRGYFAACCRPVTEYLSDKSSRILLKERGGVRCLETTVFLPEFQEGAVPGIVRSFTVGMEEEIYRGLLDGRYEPDKERDGQRKADRAGADAVLFGGDCFYIGT